MPVLTVALTTDMSDEEKSAAFSNIRDLCTGTGMAL